MQDDDVNDPSARDKIYLPFRIVIDETRLTTKYRLEFDASARTRTDQSLNSCLLAGPPLQRNLVGLLARFRCNKIAILYNISKMFTNIIVAEEDRDYMSFLRCNPSNPQDPVEIYRHKQMIFGATDSPFQEIMCIQCLIQTKRLLRMSH